MLKDMSAKYNTIPVMLLRSNFRPAHFFLTKDLVLAYAKLLAFQTFSPKKLNMEFLYEKSKISGHKVGIQHVTVARGGRTANFDVEVMALTSIEVEKPPTKTDYKVGEPLDLTGILIMGHYTGADPTKRRSGLIPLEQLSFDGYDPNRSGRQQRIRITVRGQSANFFVNIE